MSSVEIHPMIADSGADRSAVDECPPWELIVDAALDGERNMAVDRSLLDEVSAAERPRTILRLYRWSAPTLSLGRNQAIETAVDRGFCAAEGIPIVYRPTGGHAVLHGDELTYAVASNDTVRFGEGVYENYRRIAEALCRAFNRLGAQASLAPTTRRATGTGGADPPCFLSPSRYELTLGGRKVAGSAQRRLRRAFLQHGALPLTCDRERLARATRMADSAALHREMAGLNEFLPVPISSGDLASALIEAFEHQFAIRFHRRM
jgi:lipoate-protein ligase A